MRPFCLKLIFTVLFIGVATFCFACPFCNPQIKEAIYDSQFYPNLFIMLSAFLVLAVIVLLLSTLHKKRFAALTTTSSPSPVPLTTTAIILGIGIGGFIDGIVLHQILQWHEMVSNKVSALTYIGKSVNMFWDGVFHAFTLVVTFVGIVQLWKLMSRKDVQRSGYLFSGGLVAGWGLFNLVEGSIDHQFLKLHNVKEAATNPNAWNIGFLVFALLLLLCGYFLIKKGWNEMRHSA